MIKKLFPFIVGAGLLWAGIAYATTFNSNQVGTNPANGYYLQTNGATSTWVALPVASTTFINGVSGPTFTFSIVSTSSQSSITTSSAQLFLNLLQYTSGTDINVGANGIINFVNPGYISLTSLTATAPITYNSGTGAIGLTTPLATAYGGTATTTTLGSNAFTSTAIPTSYISTINNANNSNGNYGIVAGTNITISTSSTSTVINSSGGGGSSVGSAGYIQYASSTAGSFNATSTVRVVSNIPEIVIGNNESAASSTLATTTQNYGLSVEGNVVYTGTSSPSLSGVTTTLPNGIVSYYNMQGNSNDYYSVVNGSDTAMSYATSTGKIGEGASFNGSTSYININRATTYNTFSVGFWFNSTSTAASLGLFDIRNSGNNGNLDVFLASGKIMAGTYNGSANPTFTSSASYNDGNWHYVLITMNQTTLAGYVDGVSVGSVGSTATLGGASSLWYIGEQPTSGNFYKGYEDELGIWNRVLTSTEDSSLYNNGVGLTAPFTSSNYYVSGTNERGIAYIPLGAVNATLSFTTPFDNTDCMAPSPIGGNNYGWVTTESSSSVTFNFASSTTQFGYSCDGF